MDKIEKAVRAAVQGCDPHYCAQAADLLGIEHPDCFECGGDECEACAERVAGAIAAHLTPEGVEWPRFADGEPVRIGDEVLGKHGEPMAVTRVSFVDGGCYFNESHRKDGRKRGKGWRYVAGERVKRPAPPAPAPFGPVRCADCAHARVTPRGLSCALHGDAGWFATDADGFCHRGERR